MLEPKQRFAFEEEEEQKSKSQENLVLFLAVEWRLSAIKINLRKWFQFDASVLFCLLFQI